MLHRRQGQANRYIKNMGKDPTFSLNGIDVIKLTDKNFLRTLENGIRFGRWVLLENVQARPKIVLDGQKKYFALTYPWQKLTFLKPSTIAFAQ